MKRAIVMGASSGMGMEISKLLLADGWTLGIAARRSDRLMAFKEQNTDRIEFETIDVTADDAPVRLLYLIERIGGMDLFFYASGMGKQNRNLDADIEIKTVTTNGLGFTRMIDAAFNYMANNGGGHIACISSIAGTKGLGPAPSYSATKAFQSCYIQALEQLAYQRNLPVSFTDIRPGFVDTALLSGAHKYPMLMNVEYASRKIYSAVMHHRHICVIDWRWSILTRLWRFIPNFIWRRFKL